MTIAPIVLLSLTVGVLVGLLGIGGGVVLVPALVYLLHYDQHMAQGTSLFILLPPIGLGALREYWKNGQVDLRAGIYCALGFLIGGYGGGKIAVPMPSNVLKAIFGCFLMMSAVLLWRKTRAVSPPDPSDAGPPKENPLRALGIFCTAGFCGIAAGMVGIGGGLLAFLAYWKAGYVDLHTGALLIPGVFIGGILGGMMARQLNARRMAEIFAGLMFLLGGWQVFSAWRG